MRARPKLAWSARPDGGKSTFGAPGATTAAEAEASAGAEATGRSGCAAGASVKQKYENVIAIFQKTGYAPTIGPPGRSPAMPDPATPAPSTAACLGAAGRAARRHRIIERALRGWSTGTIAGAVDLGGARSSGGRSSCARVDPARAHVRLQTARLDERANRADGDKARAAAEPRAGFNLPAIL